MNKTNIKDIKNELLDILDENVRVLGGKIRYEVGLPKKLISKILDMQEEPPKRGNRWKGNKAGYHATHAWFSTNYGTPNYCEFCRGESKKAKTYEWALIKGKKYSRDREDYMRLCHSCHVKYDWIESRTEAFRKNVHNKAVYKKRAKTMHKKYGMKQFVKWGQDGGGRPKKKETINQQCLKEVLKK